MDAIDRRSAIASLILHGALVGAALVSFAPGAPPPMPAPAVTASPPPAPPAGELVLADEAFPTMPAVILPPLAPAGSPHLIASTMLPPGREDARGTSGEGGTRVALPITSSSETPLREHLRGLAAAPPPLDWAEDRRRTAASALQIFIERTFRQRWKQHANQLTNRTLVLWLRTDAQGRIAKGGLFHSTTGLAELDHAIETWLTGELVSLPAIEPGAEHYVKIELR